MPAENLVGSEDLIKEWLDSQKIIHVKNKEETKDKKIAEKVEKVGNIAPSPVSTTTKIIDTIKKNAKGIAGLRGRAKARIKRDPNRYNLRSRIPKNVVDAHFAKVLAEKGFTLDEKFDPNDINYIDLDFENEIGEDWKEEGDTVESILTASTEFPKPKHKTLETVYHVPESVSPEEIIGKSVEQIYKLIDSDTLGIDGTHLVKPKNVDEAMESEYSKYYLEAMERELYELEDNGTWKLVYCPEGRKPITCRWVFDIKRNNKNQVIRFKARLVVQGFKQIEGVDFHKTFSSTAQMRTFRVVVALSVKYGLKITQYDVSNAFCKSDIDTDIYMTFPPGFAPDNVKENQCYKLLKGLYGLKQASRLWAKLISKAFKKAGLTVCQSEPGIFHVKGDDLCLVNLWVDDYLICCKNEALRKQIEKVLHDIFSVEPMGAINLFLGIVIEAKEDMSEVVMHQEPYHDRVLESTKHKDCNIAKTPAEASVKLSVEDCPTEGEKKPDWPYMSVLGSLMYSAMATRPDIVQRVCQLARFGSNPGTKHVKAMKHLLKYLKGTKKRGIRYRRPPGDDEKVQIIAFVDSDWAGCPDTRRSTIGWSVHLCGGPVSWKSQLKKTLALSSCEAEFMGLSDVAREIMWLCKFLKEIGVPYHTPKVFCDSNSAIYWAEDPVQHQRNKHVELKYYFIRDVVDKELVKLYRINTKYNIADLFTKPATRTMINELVEALMGYRDPNLSE